MNAELRQCRACGVRLKRTGKSGRPREASCGAERCDLIVQAGRDRERCGRCHSKLNDTPAARTQAICDRCVEDICDLRGIILPAPLKRSCT